jgi:hypothetical protein
MIKVLVSMTGTGGRSRFARGHVMLGPEFDIESDLESDLESVFAKTTSAFIL